MNKTEIPAAVSAVVNGWYFGDYTADEICTVASMTAGEAAAQFTGYGNEWVDEDETISVLSAMPPDEIVYVVRDDAREGEPGFEPRMVSVITAAGVEVYEFTA